MKIQPINLKFSLLLVILTGLFSSPSYSCTTVFCNNNNIAKAVARSTDLYFSDQPLLKVMPRGMNRSGEAGEGSLNWKSKYGNVVITAFHTNAVSDGVNEKGLAVHLLYLSGTEYPKATKNERKISNLLWSQYLLDNYSTVDEALKDMQNIQIVSTIASGREWPIHITLEDSTGDSAIIEYVQGKMQIYHGKQYQVMTNEPAYNIQLDNLKRYQPFGGKLPIPGDSNPLSRFVRVSTYMKTIPVPKNYLESIANVLSVIRTAMVPFGAVEINQEFKAEDTWPTLWVSVADVTNKIYYFNSTTAPNIVWVDLNKINFKEGAPVLSIDPTDIQLKGDITQQLATK